MNESTLKNFRLALEKYPTKYLIVSPPRCASTAVARIFWNLENIRYYSHEPFEKIYFDGEDLSAAIGSIKNPTDLSTIVANKTEESCNGLVIKEMPYQVGGFFPELFDAIDTPIVFLIRDPRLSIKSRMQKKVEANSDPLYAKIETGWELLEVMVNYCKRVGKKYVILNTTLLRLNPQETATELFNALEIPFNEEYLNWEPLKDFSLDNLAGAHDHLYSRVLHSSGIQAPFEEVPALDTFTKETNLRNHVEKCLDIFDNLSTDEKLINLNVEMEEGYGEQSLRTSIRRS